MKNQWYVIRGENGHVFLQNISARKPLLKGQKLPASSNIARGTGCKIGKHVVVKAVCNDAQNTMFDALDSLGDFVSNQSQNSPHFIVELENLFREVTP